MCSTRLCAKGAQPIAPARPPARPHPVGPLEPRPGEVAHDLAGGAGAAEGLEEEPHGALDLRVRVQRQALRGRVPDKPEGGVHPQLAPPRLVELAAEEARAQHVELGLAHRALQP
jgi:hypothetical protein